MSDPAAPEAHLAPHDDTANDLTQQAAHAGSAVAADTADVAKDATDRASRLVSDAGIKASAVAEGQKDGLAQRMDDMATAIHRSGEQLEGQSDFMAKLVERGADELSDLAATLRSNDLQGLAGKVQDLAKRQPAMFVGAAIAAGFAAMRLGRIAASGATRNDLPRMPESFDGRP